MADPPPARVLLIRPSALGDVARSVPALVSLRNALPQAQIDWLVQDTFADAVRHHPALSGVVTYPRSAFGRLYMPATAAQALHWARDLRRRRYDLAIDLQGLFRSGLFARLTGAPRRVGFANARELGWLGYNRRHFVDPGLHTVERMLALVAAEGFAIQRDMRLYVGPEDQRWLDDFLVRCGIAAQPFAVLAPTARWRCKCWPLDSFIQIARRLLDGGQVGSRLFVLASPSEREYLRPLLAAFGAGGDSEKASVICPPTTVGQMMALLSRTALLVCNDSAPLHIAVGFGRPLVTIFGPTDPALVGPYQRDDTVVRPPGQDRVPPRLHRHLRDDQSLIGQVPVEAVWEKIQEQLRTPQASATP